MGWLAASLTIHWARSLRNRRRSRKPVARLLRSVRRTVADIAARGFREKWDRIGPGRISGTPAGNSHTLDEERRCRICACARTSDPPSPVRSAAHEADVGIMRAILAVRVTRGRTARRGKISPRRGNTQGAPGGRRPSIGTGGTHHPGAPASVSPPARSPTSVRSQSTCNVIGLSVLQTSL
jgi:hypothetical protein